MPPVISIIGWSGSGKTTFIEKLIPILREQGIRVAIIKRDGHDFQMDREEKDTWRFTKAGAELVAIASDTHAAVLENRPVELETLLTFANGVDLVITEGFHNRSFPQIEVYRKELGALRCPDKDRLIAVVTDDAIDLGIPTFSPDDIRGAAQFIISQFALDDKCHVEYRAARDGNFGESSTARLFVDGREIPLTPFVQSLLMEVNTGILRTLKDTGNTQSPKIRIELS